MQIRNVKAFARLSCLGTIALMPLLILPAMIGVLVDEAGMAESFAGWSASSGAAGPGLAALLVDGGQYGQVFVLAIVLFALGIACFSFASRSASGSSRNSHH